jgi:hydrogenase maturation protease
MPAQARGSLLVIGIGSELHGDDAAGRMVAARIEALPLDGVRVRSVVQLVPELVEDLATCATVVFVDADPGCAATTVRPVRAATGTPAVTHHTTPAGLLQLAEAVGVPVPRAVLLGVPARCLGLGSLLSEQTRAGVELAVEAILQLAEARPAAPGDGG